MAKTAVVIGSTGLIGSSLIEQLVHERGFKQILAISRRVENPNAWGSRVRFLSFDFTNWQDLELQLSSFIGGTSAIFFCCLGTTIGKAGSEEAFRVVDYEAVSRFSVLAQSCKAESLLVVSSLGADKNSETFYLKTKGEMEETVRSNFNGLVYFFRPSLLLGNRNEFRFGERMAIIASPFYSWLLIGPLSKYRPIEANKVAKVMIQIALHKVKVDTVIENQDIHHI